MASRDEVVRYVYEVTGDKQLADATQTMLDAARAAGQSTEQIAALETEWRRLAQQVGDSAALGRAAAQLGDLAQQEAAAGAEAQKAGLKLQILQQAEMAAAQAVHQRTQALDAARAAQADYAQGGERVAATERALAAAVKEAAADQKAANAEWKQTASALTVAEKAYERAESKQQSLENQIDSLRKKLADAGLSTTDLADAQTELAKRSGDAKDGMAALAESAEAARKASDADAARKLAEEEARLAREAANAAAALAAKKRAAEEAARQEREEAALTKELAEETKRANAERAQFAASMDRLRKEQAATAREQKNLTEKTREGTGAFARMRTGANDLVGTLARVTGVAGLVSGALAAIGAKNLFGKIVSTFTGIFDRALASEQAIGQLKATLESTGHAAGLTADELVRMADDISASTRMSKEQVLSAETRLLSYTSILRGEFPRALQLSIDQAERLGISVEQSAEIVGRALQSPSDAMAALGRQGFKLEAGQKTLLKQLEATGQTAKAQSMIMDMLAESYAGAANASTLGRLTTLWDGLKKSVTGFYDRIANSGPIDYLKQRMEGLLGIVQRLGADGTLTTWAQKIGAAMTAVLRVAFDLVERAVPAIQRFMASLDMGEVTKSINTFGARAKDVLAVVTEHAGKTGAAFGVVYDSIKLVWNLLKTGITGAAADVVGVLALLAQGALTAARGLAFLTGQSANLAPAFADMEVQIGALASVAGRFWDIARDGAKGAREAFDGLSDGIDRLGQSSSQAAKPQAELAASVKVSAERAAELRAQFEQLPKWLQAIVEPSLRAAGVFREQARAEQESANATADHAQALRAAQVDYDNAVRAYSKLLDSSTTTREEFARAGAVMDDAARKLRQLQDDARGTADSNDRLAKAFENLKVTSSESLRAIADTAETNYNTIAAAAARGEVSINEQRRAFAAYAQERLKWAATLDESDQRTIKSQLESTASAIGATDALRTLGSDGAKAGQDVARGAQTAAQAVDKVAEAAQGAEESGHSMTGAYAALVANFKEWDSTFGAVSENASRRFRELTADLFAFGVARDTLIEADTTGLAKYGWAIGEASRMVRESVDEQRALAQQAAAGWGDLSDAALEAMARQQGGLDAVADRLRSVAAETREGRGQFDLLGKTDLSPLASALDAAAARVDALRQKTMAAKAAFEDYAASAREQIAQMQGDTARAEDLRFQREMERLRKQADEASALNSAEYSEAVASATQLHQLKLRQIREQAEAQRSADRPASNDARPDSRGGGSSSAGGGGLGSSSVGGSGSGGVPAVSISVAGSLIGGTPAQLAEALARLIKPELDRIGLRSR